MRTIRFYEVAGKAWVNPQKLWAAISSKEPLRLVAHGDVGDTDAAISDALSILREGWKASMVVGLGGVLWSIALFFALVHPLLGTKLLNADIVKVSKWFVIIAGATALLQTLRVLPRFWVVCKCPLGPVERGRWMQPPVISWRKPVIRIPSVRYAYRMALVLVGLSTVVMGSGINPVVVFPRDGEPYIVEDVEIVPPLTEWEVRPKMLQTTEYAIIAAPDEDNIWVFEFECLVYHKDTLKEAKGWDAWIERRVSWVIDQLRNSAMQDMNPEWDLDEQVQYILEQMDTPEVLMFLENFLARDFDQTFDHLQMQKASVTVKRFGLSEYMAILQRQRSRDDKE